MDFKRIKWRVVILCILSFQFPLKFGNSCTYRNSLFTEGLVSMRNGFSAQRITLANFKSFKMYLNSIPLSGNFFNPAQLLVGINRSVNTEKFSKQGWRKESSDGGMNLPTRGLKYCFGGTFTAKNL